MALSRQFFYTHLTHGKLFFFKSSISGIIALPYKAISRGSPWVVPSVDVKTVLLTWKSKGCSSAYCSAGKGFLYF